MEPGPPDAIFGLVEAHKKDPRPEKVSLAIGATKSLLIWSCFSICEPFTFCVIGMCGHLIASTLYFKFQLRNVDLPKHHFKQ